MPARECKLVRNFISWKDMYISPFQEEEKGGRAENITLYISLCSPTAEDN